VLGLTLLPLVRAMSFHEVIHGSAIAGVRTVADGAKTAGQAAILRGLPYALRAARMRSLSIGESSTTNTRRLATGTSLRGMPRA
jgi:hypothetical protein